MAMKSFILISLLVVVLIATQADAQQLRANISGIVTCSVNGSVNGTAPPFANATVQLTCGGNVIASAMTNQQGRFNISVSPVLVSLNNILSTCRVVVPTPLSSCNATLPSTGGIQSALQLVGITVQGLTTIILSFITGTFTVT
ncbi:hypothetical protein M8C21_011291, partial [Ambrosia artemisiifolia]